MKCGRDQMIRSFLPEIFLPHELFAAIVNLLVLSRLDQCETRYKVHTQRICRGHTVEAKADLGVIVKTTSSWIQWHSCAFFWAPLCLLFFWGW
jgi:hypothetical protein